MWSSDGTELEWMTNATASIMNNSVVYSENYTISQLSTDDDDRIIQCDVRINSEIKSTGIVELNAFGKFVIARLGMHSTLFTL